MAPLGRPALRQLGDRPQAPAGRHTARYFCRPLTGRRALTALVDSYDPDWSSSSREAPARSLSNAAVDIGVSCKGYNAR